MPDCKGAPGPRSKDLGNKGRACGDNDQEVIGLGRKEEEVLSQLFLSSQSESEKRGV